MREEPSEELVGHGVVRAWQLTSVAPFVSRHASKHLSGVLLRPVEASSSVIRGLSAGRARSEQAQAESEGTG